MAEGRAELRTGFHRDLAAIETAVMQLFALVKESLAAATATFLDGDLAQARAVADRDVVIDDIDEELQELITRSLHLQSPAVGDLRYLITVLRVVPELERSGDLAEHIASRAAAGVGLDLPPRVRGIVEQMGAVGVQLWHDAADAWAERDVHATVRLDALDDDLDRLSEELVAEAKSGTTSVPIAVELALVARFFERLGDHAVHITERLPYLVTGQN